MTDGATRPARSKGLLEREDASLPARDIRDLAHT
jgi:hypothetical protein